MCVLKNRILLIIPQLPPRRRDNLVISIQRFVRGDEVEGRTARIVTNFGLDGGAEAGLAGGECDQVWDFGLHKDFNAEMQRDAEIRREKSKTWGQKDTPLPGPLPTRSSRGE